MTTKGFVMQWLITSSHEIRCVAINVNVKLLQSCYLKTRCVAVMAGPWSDILYVCLLVCFVCLLFLHGSADNLNFNCLPLLTCDVNE